MKLRIPIPSLRWKQINLGSSQETEDPRIMSKDKRFASKCYLGLMGGSGPYWRFFKTKKERSEFNSVFMRHPSSYMAQKYDFYNFKWRFAMEGSEEFGKASLDDPKEDNEAIFIFNK